MEDLRRVVGRRLLDARRAVGLSQREIAGRLGVTHVAYGDFERGRSAISVEHLLTVAEVLGRPVSYFVGVVDPGLSGLDELTREIVELVQFLPARERLAVLTYARFVAQQAARDAANEAE